MVSWDSIIRFEAGNGNVLFASLPLSTTPDVGLKVEGYTSIEDLEAGGPGKLEIVRKASISPLESCRFDQLTVPFQLLSPVPVTGIPIVCIGVNYKSHAEEGKVSIGPFDKL